ncbi:MAG: imidazole glycerol phosphate synthase subunit HisH [Cytophagaceae bacterium]|nr:imidazole glycerol phosphate synthase subunit HisH [Gemmatimonadaceae bacterium]
MRVTILDYGVGNLHSLSKAIAAAGAEPVIVDDASAATRAEVLVLPGVGAFAPAAARFVAAREPLRDAILAGLPTLGICLGMQLMFDASDEGSGAGLGVFAGRVTRLTSEAVPQIGWNALDDPTEPLLAESGLREVYYANSFACRAVDPAIVGAWSEHEGDRFAAVVRRQRSLGVQFHPEKSSTQGVAFIRAFLQEAAA